VEHTDVLGDLYFDLRGGRDTLFLVDVMGANATIDTGVGVDTAALVGVKLRTLTLRMGESNDAAAVWESSIDDFFADLGGGDDQLDVQGSIFDRVGLIGGTHSTATGDRFRWLNNRSNIMSMSGFESRV
jgi:hypothetical protein